MIDKIDIGSHGYKVEEPLKKYIQKRLGKLDRYLPRSAKKDIVVKVVISEIGKTKGEKFNISVAMDIPSGKVIAAKDECTNVFAGVDLVEAKLTGQIRRYKIECSRKTPKKKWSKLFIRKK